MLTKTTTWQLMLSNQKGLKTLEQKLVNYSMLLKNSIAAIDSELQSLVSRRNALKAKVDLRLKQLVSWGFDGTRTQARLEE